MRGTPSPSNPAEKMDRMYRWTRHVYDLTRRYYLLGRDDLLDKIAEHEPGRVLEIGCGTARNLRALAQANPHHQLYGIDASRAMLATARSSLDRAGITGQVTLGQGLAEHLDSELQLGVAPSFDAIFFSYALSMIPEWRTALRRALNHLAPDGRLYIVDFWDQADLPDWIATSLQKWLALFDVTHRPALLDTLRELDADGYARCSITPVARRYAYRATVERTGKRHGEGPPSLHPDPADRRDARDRPADSATATH